MTVSDTLYVLSKGLGNLSEYEKASFRVAKKSLSNTIWGNEGFNLEGFITEINEEARLGEPYPSWRL
jgi:hypothetical protein